MNLLTNDQLIKENQRLLYVIDKLEQKIKDYEQFSIRTCPPHKTYKQLEEELAQAKEKHQEEIDAKIKPLQDLNKQLSEQLNTSYDVNQGQKNRIKDLEIVRDNLNRMIDFAVGYISATQPHTDKHPMEVKQWLFKGLE